MMPVGRGIIKKLRKFNNPFKSEKKLKTEQQNRVRRQSICVGDFGNSSKACPICKEEFELTYDKKLQDWVAENAILVDHLYHKHCYEHSLQTNDFGRLRAKSIANLRRHSVVSMESTAIMAA